MLSPIAFFALTLAQIGPPSAGEVTLPVATWDGMSDELETTRREPRPDVAVAAIDRRIEGTFNKGLFHGVLVARFEVLPGHTGHLRIPVLDARASLREALLDGKRTSLLGGGAMYTVGVDRPGRHEVRVEFYWGREQDRYARRLAFKLPPSGPTAIEVLVPEVEIDARLARGALTAARASGGSTKISGHLDASGTFDLSWSRRLTHRSQDSVRTEARLHAVLTIQEALVSGLAVFDVTVLEGETDRIDLSLPEGLEVVKVEGEAVLQWRTEPGPKSQLTVLLRYLVEDQVRIAVRFQQPAEPGKPVELKLPTTVADTALSGAAGIQAPAGLDVRVEELAAADALSPRDVPPELGELSSSPLIHAFGFTAAPRIRLSVARHGEVELTSTLIDEIQASTVLIESGLEVTKLKLRVRNNTRQYLTMRLPQGAVLTHSLIDGVPVRPAVAADKESDGTEALLLPLRQSERLGESGARTHLVRDGETLSDVANFYYSDPTAWERILEHNPEQLGHAGDLQVGQELKIPAKEGARVEESSFVVEVAYKVPRLPMDGFDATEVQLPELDVDTVDVTWHLYLPESLSPLGFDANLTQYSHVRYDPFRRLRGFIDLVLGVDDAWAGSGYKSILSQRRVIWQAESDRKSGGEVVLSSFPLVGERYKFKRILLGDETPRIGLFYVTRSAVEKVRWAALGFAFVIGLAFFAVRRSPRTVVLGAVLLVLLLLVGHYFLGVHRRLLWGLDLALLVAVARPWASRAGQAVSGVARAPWKIGELLTIKHFVLLLGAYVLFELVLQFPLLLSSAAFLILLVLRWRTARADRMEVAHA